MAAVTSVSWWCCRDCSGSRDNDADDAAGDVKDEAKGDRGDDVVAGQPAWWSTWRRRRQCPPAASRCSERSSSSSLSRQIFADAAATVIKNNA